MTPETQLNQTDPAAFLRLLAGSIESALGTDQSLGLLVVHLENFDRLVSAFGYRMGNGVIAAFAKRLQESIRKDDKLVRISESKFAVIISPLRNEGILVLAANKIGKICGRPIPTDQSEITVSLRMGMTMSPQHGSEPETLLQNAETALLAALSDDAAYAIFSPEQSVQASDSLRLELELDTAIHGKEFELYYQPKIAARSFSPRGAEALIRWQSPKRGFVSPEIFVPLADRPGRMEPLTAFVLNSALRQAAQWPEALSVSVNVTPRALLMTELVETVETALKMWDVDPPRLCIEITEGAIMSSPEVSFRTLSALRALGVRISIDDFGTGYSSLAYFKNIPADELKIDKSFVLNMFEDEGDKRIVRTVVQLAKEFGLEVTAEGVEDEKTARMLAQLGCDCLQGYHYSRPIPQHAFLGWLSDYRPRATS